MKSVTNATATWERVRTHWSRGDLEAARIALGDLTKQANTDDIHTWRRWGNAATALQDLSLAEQAYGEVYRRQPTDRGILFRHLYLQLQTGADPAGVARTYHDATWSSEDEESWLVRLALEADMHYRLGDVAQASRSGQEFLRVWHETDVPVFEFLPHVRDRIWVMLARLAEESASVSTVRQLLVELDRATILATDLQPVVHLLCLLIEQPFQGLVKPAKTAAEHIERLTSLMAIDLSMVRPPVSGAILSSLHKTLLALQGDNAGYSLLEEAINLRSTNVLAQHLYMIDRERKSQGKTQPLVTNVAHLLGGPSYLGRPIARDLARPAPRKDVTFSFVALGGGSHIGGSAYLVDLNGTRLLLDVGMDVAGSPAQSYKRLKNRLLASNIVGSLAELDAVLVSHAHLDHVGLLPGLYADPDLPHVRTSSGIHARIPFYASEETRALAHIMLTDAVRVTANTKDMLYSEADVSGALADLRPPKDGMLHLFRDMGHVELIESGHILGSRMIFLEKNGLRVLYTGDLNTRSQLVAPAAPGLRDLQPDVLIVESTYGYDGSEWLLPRAWQEQLFVAHLDRVLRRGGVVLLPAFAVGRSQEVLGLVADHARQYPQLSYGIYIDGLSRTVTRYYDRHIAHLPERYQTLRQSIDHRVTIVSEDADRETLIRTCILGRPNVVIASSGMLKRGSVSYEYAAYIAADPKNAIFYTGYLAEDSEAIAFIGGEFDGGTDDVKICCEQRRFHFSAHASREDLLQFVVGVRPQAVILVHGDTSKRTSARNNLYDQLLRLESESFRVFLGQEGRQVHYRQGRYSQDEQESATRT